METRNGKSRLLLRQIFRANSRDYNAWRQCSRALCRVAQVNYWFVMRSLLSRWHSTRPVLYVREESTNSVRNIGLCSRIRRFRCSSKAYIRDAFCFFRFVCVALTAKPPPPHLSHMWVGCKYVFVVGGVSCARMLRIPSHSR